MKSVVQIFSISALVLILSACGDNGNVNAPCPQGQVRNAQNQCVNNNNFGFNNQNFNQQQQHCVPPTVWNASVNQCTNPNIPQNVNPNINPNGPIVNATPIPQNQQCGPGQYFDGLMCAMIVQQPSLSQCELNQIYAPHYGCILAQPSCMHEYAYTLDGQIVCVPARVHQPVIIDRRGDRSRNRTHVLYPRGDSSRVYERPISRKQARINAREYKRHNNRLIKQQKIDDQYYRKTLKNNRRGRSRLHLVDDSDYEEVTTDCTIRVCP